MEILKDVAKAMQSVLGEEADYLAKKTGFIKRERKITGSSFIKTLLFAWMQNKAPSAEGLARAGFTHKLEISAQGLTQRFTEESGIFVRSVLEKALTKVIKSKAVDIEILNRFSAIYVADCSKIALPNELQHIWKGTGGHGNMSNAGLKIDASIELKTGQLQFGLLDGKHSDNRSPIAKQKYGKEVLHLRDLGYFNLARMNAQSELKEYWISRLQPRTKVFTETGQPIDLLAYLSDKSSAEIKVTIGTLARVPARLIASKLSKKVANRRRAKLRKNANKHGRKPSTENLALCNWNLYITNVEEDKLSLKECVMLYRVRWQIELLFKLWKTNCKLGHSSSENPHQILCELYIKLLIILIQHWIILTGLWVIPERSLVKGVQMIREQSSFLAHAIHDFHFLISVLNDLSQRFLYGCSLNRRKRKLNTVDQMLKYNP
jgi:hypothetical protein